VKSRRAMLFMFNVVFLGVVLAVPVQLAAQHISLTTGTRAYTE